jgi:hypothetical protein
MTNNNLRSSVFDNPWGPGTCALSLASGERVWLQHRDYVLIPPGEDFAIVAFQGRGFRVLSIDQIVSVDFEKPRIPKGQG